MIYLKSENLLKVDIKTFYQSFGQITGVSNSLSDLTVDSTRTTQTVCNCELLK